MKAGKVPPHDSTDPREASMRRDPQQPWSPALGFIRWPDKFNRREVVIALLYGDLETLLVDYDRAARWEYSPGVSARIHTAYLERANDGTPWLSLGIREYYARRKGSGRVEAFREPPDRRIVVRVYEGGKNRRKAIRLVKAADAVTVLFNTCNLDDPDGLIREVVRLKRGCVCYAPETFPIRLSGLSTLGHIALTGGTAVPLQA
jgi:hypothetical protein